MSYGRAVFLLNLFCLLIKHTSVPADAVAPVTVNPSRNTMLLVITAISAYTCLIQIFAITSSINVAVLLQNGHKIIARSVTEGIPMINPPPWTLGPVYPA